MKEPELVATGYDKVGNMDRWYMHGLNTTEVIIAQHQEGICLNPLEYLMTEDGEDFMVFPSSVAAYFFLISVGVPAAVAEDVILVSAMCLEIL